MYVISSGSVRVTTKDPSGGEITLTDLHENDFFGEGSLLKGIPRTATIIALEDAELLEMTKAELDRMAKKYPSIVKTIESFYLSRVAHTVETMKERFRGGRS
jgi:CRP-like cAMP-binding protein